MKAEDFPLPGTDAASGIGCTCPQSKPAEGTISNARGTASKRSRSI